MKKHKCVSRKNMPQNYPIISTVVAALALDYWKAADWLWGAMGVLFLIVWVGCIARSLSEDEVNIFDDQTKKPS